MSDMSMSMSMSGWELFTWWSVAVLAVGPLLVLAFFLRDLPDLWRRHRESDSGSVAERSASRTFPDE